MTFVKKITFHEEKYTHFPVYTNDKNMMSQGWRKYLFLSKCPNLAGGLDKKMIDIFGLTIFSPS